MNSEENKVPSKEEIRAFYKEQIEVAKMRKELSSLNADIAESEARRIEAIAKAAHFSRPQQSDRSPEEGGPNLPPGVVDHVVTQEDLDNNPELIDQGIKVGDHIGITSAPETPETPPSKEQEERKERKLKKVEEA